jgi:hypothetical protein
MPWGFGPGFGGRGFGRGFFGGGLGFGRGLGICKWLFLTNSPYYAPYIKDAWELEKRFLEERIRLIDGLLKDYQTRTGQ